MDYSTPLHDVVVQVFEYWYLSRSRSDCQAKEAGIGGGKDLSTRHDFYDGTTKYNDAHGLTNLHSSWAAVPSPGFLDLIEFFQLQFHFPWFNVPSEEDEQQRMEIERSCSIRFLEESQVITNAGHLSELSLDQIQEIQRMAEMHDASYMEQESTLEKFMNRVLGNIDTMCI